MGIHRQDYRDQNNCKVAMKCETPCGHWHPAAPVIIPRLTIPFPTGRVCSSRSSLETIKVTGEYIPNLLLAQLPLTPLVCRFHCFGLLHHLGPLRFGLTLHHYFHTCFDSYTLPCGFPRYLKVSKRHI